MILVALLIGVILIVSAIRGTQGALFTALGQDVPAYVVWAAAIVALGVIGYVPGLKPISRGLLALVLIVIILRNYQQILAGVKAVSTPPATQTSQVSSAAPATPSVASATPLGLAASATASGISYSSVAATLGSSASDFGAFANAFGSIAGVAP